MSDLDNLKDLKEMAKKFRDERDWEQFHNAKDLAMAIAIEAGELQELFLWKDTEDIEEKIKNDKSFREQVGEELADVIFYCMHLANASDFDISKIVADKLRKNEQKYPVENIKGTAPKKEIKSRREK